MDTQADLIAADPTLAMLPSTEHVVMVPGRICVVCKATKPLDESHWEVKERRPWNVTIWDDTCKVCRDLQLQQQDHKLRSGAVSRLMSELSRGRNVPQSHELLGSLYKHFRGPEGLATEAKRVYDGAMGKEDFKVAARIIGMVVQLQVKTDGLQQQEVIKDLDLEKAREYAATLETALAAKLLEMQRNEQGQYALEAHDG